MELTAFSAVEIDYLLETDEIDPEPTVPKPDAIAISRLGDIWCLDHHRVGCGDALQVRLVDEVLGGVKLSVAFIDPPYNIPIDGFASGNGAIRHRDFAMASGEMSEGQFTGFLAQALSVLRSHLKAGSPLYVFMDWRHIFELLSAARSIGLELLNLCVWAKTTPGLGSFYRSQHELVAVFKAGEGELRNNLALSGKRRNRSNLWTYRGLNSFGDDRDELVKLHPTVKPVALIGDALRDVTMRGDAVIDTFLGSGSTLMAAEETGRTCFGIELDPLYI